MEDVKEEEKEPAETGAEAETEPEENGTEVEKEPAETELELEILMNFRALYDYLLRHSYSSAAGILGSCFGVAGILLFLSHRHVLYLIMGLVILFYLPVELARRAKLTMLTNPVFKKPLRYRFSADGIEVAQGEDRSFVGWDGCTKAVSTKKSIILYTGKNNACVFPREQITGGAETLISVLASHMEAKRVKIKY